LSFVQIIQRIYRALINNKHATACRPEAAPAQLFGEAKLA
jgi:hypothetical protein